jgi:hypothetical protein
MCPLAEGEQVEQFGDIVTSGKGSGHELQRRPAATHLTFESWLSSLKLARMAALSFCTTARSSAMVLEARTLRMNCFTAGEASANSTATGSDAVRTRAHFDRRGPRPQSPRGSAGVWW